MTLRYKLAKRVLDIGGAAAGLIVTAPLTVPTAIAVRATMGTPILFEQERPGKDGKPFKLKKFRTMRNLRPGEDMLGSDADRITTLGQFIRSTSIDELPTLLNVLTGEMSLVGPRPLLMRYLERYNDEQARRHEVKPGVTGWAQINGRNAISWEEKFEFDCWYVDHASLALDVEILIRTIFKVVEREGISGENQATAAEFVGS